MFTPFEPLHLGLVLISIDMAPTSTDIFEIMLTIVKIHFFHIPADNTVG